MSNSSIRLQTPVKESDFIFIPIQNFNRKCTETTCTNRATFERYKVSLNESPDKSSKIFVCEVHKLTTNV